MTHEQAKDVIRGAILEEIQGLLEQVWIKDGGIHQEFSLTPKGAVPPEVTPELMKEVANELAKAFER